MQLIWLEDLQALAQTCSFSRAAELRQVTHPAFGRRIKALEDWAGTALVAAAFNARQLARVGDARLEVAFETRLYRPRRTLGTLTEAVWQMASSD